MFIMGKSDFTLKDFEESCKARQFGSLVLYHIDKNRKTIFTSKSKLIKIFSSSLKQSINDLPKEAKPLVEEFIDKWNLSIKQPHFWLSDCAEVFRKIINDAENTLKIKNILYNDDTLFDFFNIVIMNYAYNMVCEKKMEIFARSLFKKHTLDDIRGN